MLSLRIRKSKRYYSMKAKAIVAELEMGELKVVPEDMVTVSFSLLEDCVGWTKERLSAIKESKKIFEALDFPLPIEEAIQEFVTEDKALEKSLHELKKLREVTLKREKDRKKAEKKRMKERKKQKRAEFQEKMNALAPRTRPICTRGHTDYCCDDCFGNHVYCYCETCPEEPNYSNYQCCWCHLYPCYHNIWFCPLMIALIFGLCVGFYFLLESANEDDGGSDSN